MMFNRTTLKSIAFVLILLIGVLMVYGVAKEDKAVNDGKINVTEVPEEEQKSDSEKKIVLDTTGASVEMKQSIEKVAVVPIPWTSIAYAIDGTGERLVGIHPSAKESYSNCILKNLAPEIENVSTDAIGMDFAINMEEVQKINPDVMIVWDYQTKEAEQLKTIGIPAVSLKYGTLEDLQSGIKVIGSILDKEEKAEKLVAYHQDAITYFQSKEDQLNNTTIPKVLYLRDEELKVAGKGAVNTVLIQMAGGENVAKDVAGQWTTVTMEQVIKWNPEIIIISQFSDVTPQSLFNNSIKGQDWSQIDAVKNKKVYKAPMGIYRWDAPCAETPLMIEWMAQIFQPDIFNDFVLEDELKDFYKEFLNYELSQEDVNLILQKQFNKR